MKVFAYAAERYAKPTQFIAGVKPMTSPPLTASTFDPKWLEGHDLIIFNLHGRKGEKSWYGDSEDRKDDTLFEYHGPLALDWTVLRKAHLGGAVVFGVNCFLGDKDHPMAKALLSAGASAIVAGSGLNFAGVKMPAGADILGMWFRIAYGPTRNAESALRIAKAILKRSKQTKAVRDALAFRIITK